MLLQGKYQNFDGISTYVFSYLATWHMTTCVYIIYILKEKTTKDQPNRYWCYKGIKGAHVLPQSPLHMCLHAYVTTKAFANDTSNSMHENNYERESEVVRGQKLGFSFKPPGGVPFRKGK